MRIFFYFTFLFRKNYFMLEKIFRKSQFILLHLYYNFVAWQVIGNALIKYHRLVFQMQYFNPKYLAMDDDDDELLLWYG